VAQRAEEEAVAATLVRGLVAGSANASTAPVGPGVSTEVPVVQTPPASSQLVWGRWADASSGAGDISVARDVARLGRVATVGNDQYILYRTETGTGDVVSGLGSYQFSLQQGQAQYTAPGQAPSAATVQSG
jgi:hypothetical protein